ncbi:cytochrome C biosynthesis protein [Peptoniphilus catoniae]|uniref:cytochrome C biosynthesis protein n=1 Tax=Peptoniphilus catoniae TaxID=1660341 RepID=UPI0010FD33E9|nr:cytochrome C biosynthesis protein [Peptoniphilus catoniae]
MTSIMEAVLKNDEYIKISLYAIVASVLFTFIVGFAARRLKFAKYIPGLILICIGMFSFFTVVDDLFNPDNIETLVIFIISCASGIISLLFALIMGIVQNDLG